MKLPDADAAISHAKQADLAALCIADTVGGAGLILLIQIVSKNDT